MMRQDYSQIMRTTITLDEDVAEKLQAEMRRRRSNSFKETLNDVLRRGLLARRELGAAEPFKVRPRRLGSRSGLNYDDIGGLLEQVEGASHK
jgi:Arc/MetJ family transcription regulator